MKKCYFWGILLSIFSILAIHNVDTHASVNNFIIKDFQADYYLSKDINGRSVLKTVEKITAEFPSFNQNHGIERAIPKNYDGHSIKINIESVVDADGRSINYSKVNKNDSLVVRIGDKDTYVHGEKIYQITYTQHDVTRYFEDNKSDEFYWDVNGTGWAQPFDSVVARLHIDSSISSALNGDMSCYFGAYGEKGKCLISLDDDGVITANVSNLTSYSGMTIAVGFKAHTFNEYKMSFMDYIFKYYGIFSLIIGILAFCFVVTLRIIKGQNAKGRGIIVAEYLPPDGVDIADCSVIFNRQSAWLASLFIDFAVRHKIKIIENTKNSTKKPDYDLELISTEGMTNNELSVARILFGDDLIIGSIYTIRPNKKDPNFAIKISSVYVKLKAKLYKSDLYDQKIKIKSLMLWAMIVSIFTLALGIFIQNNDSVLSVGLVVYGGGFLIFIMYIIRANMKPLSEKGRVVYDYLEGLSLYINVAEEQRLKVLQSPEGSEKTPIDTSDTKKLVHLYERVLPYAVLFGDEKKWTEVLGKYYEIQEYQPDWYAGNSLMNMAIFSSSINNFSSITTSVSSIASSSSGGSSGGGFSGGGGGGGGGGGW